MAWFQPLGRNQNFIWSQTELSSVVAPPLPVTFALLQKRRWLRGCNESTVERDWHGVSSTTGAVLPFLSSCWFPTSKLGTGGPQPTWLHHLPRKQTNKLFPLISFQRTDASDMDSKQNSWLYHALPRHAISSNCLCQLLLAWRTLEPGKTTREMQIPWQCPLNI